MLALPQSAIQPASTALLFHVEIPATGALAQDSSELVTRSLLWVIKLYSANCSKLGHTFWRNFYPRFWLLVKLRGETWISIATSAARDHRSDRWVGVSTCELRKWKGFAKQFGQVRGSIWFDLVWFGLIGRIRVGLQFHNYGSGWTGWTQLERKIGWFASNWKPARWPNWNVNSNFRRGFICLICWLVRLLTAVSICFLCRTGNPSCQKPLCQFYGQTDPGHWSRVFQEGKGEVIGEV